VGIGDWLKKLRGREDERAIEHAQESRFETPDERHATEDYEGLVTDERAGRSLHEPNVEDAERFADDS
jgi:hypothetical protein